MTKTISNNEDIIDSRDIIARIEELENERECVLEDNADEKGEAPDALKEWDESDEGRELKSLRALVEEAEGYAPDWEYGEALIRDSYFKEYAQQLAEDCGMIDKADKWPNRCIDWDQAADELKEDYTSVDFDGVEYWIRS